MIHARRVPILAIALLALCFGCDRGMTAAKKSCAKGDGEACFIVAGLLREGGDPREACSYAQQSCRLGYQFGCQMQERDECRR